MAKREILITGQAMVPPVMGGKEFDPKPPAGPPPDVAAPILQSAVIPANGLTLALTYNEALDVGSVPSAGAYSLSGTARTVSSVGVLGAVVTLTLSGAVVQGAVVAVSYTPGGTPVQDLAGNDAAPLVSQATTNNSTVPGADVTPPVLSSAAVNAGGTALLLTYNETLDAASVPSPNDYSLFGTPALVTAAGISGAVVTLTLSQLALPGQTITLNYVAGANPVRDVAGNNAAGLTGQAVTNGSAATYTAPTVPVNAKCGYFIVGDDLVDATTWPTRKDIFGAGAPVLTSGSVNAAGWPTPEGNRKSFACNGTTSYGRITGLAPQATGDDPALEIVVFYKVNALNASNTIFGWTSTSSSTPKRVVAFTSGGYRVTQQATTSVFTHNATNLLQQMLRVRWVNNGAGGNDITLWRNEEIDPVAGTGVSVPGNGTLANAVAAQAVNTFTFGAQDNGGSVVNFLNGEVFAIWVRDPAAAPLTDDEAVEIHNFMLGAFNVQPLYTSPVDHLLLLNFGQSNCLAQGLATGAVAGLPDSQVKESMRSINNTVVEPLAYQNLDLRGTVHGAQHYLKRGSFAKPHHMAGVGKGATNAGSNWGGQNGAGPSNGLQGLYSTDLPSEVRRNIFLAKARFGGAPRVQWTWLQGESDAAAGSVVAGQYAANLGAIKAYIRKFIQTAFGIANAHGHVLKLNPTLQTGGGIVTADLNTINSGIDTQVSGDANLHAVTSWSALTNTIYQNGDNLHMSDAACPIVAAGVVASVKSVDAAL